MEVKKINLEGLEGKSLETANAINSMIDKVNSIEVKTVDLSPLEKEIAELKNNNSVSDIEVKLAKMETDLASRLNEIEKKATTTKVEHKGTNAAAAIIEEFKKMDVKSFSDLKKIKDVELEIKADIVPVATSDYSGTVGRTQEVSPVMFNPLRPLAFIPIMRTGYVSNGKSIIMWTPANYTANTGYVGENTNTVTENGATALEKTRQMAKISAKQYLTAETMEDLPQFAQRLQDQLNSNALLFLDNEILSGNGADGTQPNHIYGIIGKGSTAFVAADAAPVFNANIADLVDAAATQIEIALYKANTVVMHPKLANKLRRTKSTTGEYLVNQLLTGEEVMGGLRVIRTMGIGANAMIVCDSNLLQLWIKRNMTLKIGQFGSDVELDRYTAVLFTRAQCLVEDFDKAGVVYIADVAADIQAINEVKA